MESYTTPLESIQKAEFEARELLKMTKRQCEAELQETDQYWSDMYESLSQGISDEVDALMKRTEQEIRAMKERESMDSELGSGSMTSVDDGKISQAAERVARKVLNDLLE